MFGSSAGCDARVSLCIAISVAAMMMDSIAAWAPRSSCDTWVSDPQGAARAVPPQTRLRAQVLLRVQHHRHASHGLSQLGAQVDVHKQRLDGAVAKGREGLVSVPRPVAPPAAPAHLVMSPDTGTRSASSFTSLVSMDAPCAVSCVANREAVGSARCSKSGKAGRAPPPRSPPSLCPPPEPTDTRAGRAGDWWGVRRALARAPGRWVGPRVASPGACPSARAPQIATHLVQPRHQGLHILGLAHQRHARGAGDRL